MKDIEKKVFMKCIMTAPSIYLYPLIWKDVSDTIFPWSIKMLHDGYEKIENTTSSL